jgi:hypothetical protein
MQDGLVSAATQIAVKRFAIQHEMREALLRNDMAHAMECAYRLCGIDKNKVCIRSQRTQKVVSIMKFKPQKAGTI